MACIIKAPNATRGVISFTTPEMRELINANSNTKQYLIENRKDWIYLLHHNWQPGVSDPFYDANLCNVGDLVNGGECLDMDCCNFSPIEYAPTFSRKSFDVLFVTRAVTFKRLNVFYKVCKELLKKKPDIKILLICSVPEVDCDPANPKQIYLDMFSREERKNFLAMFFDYDYPFSMDKDFLAHFYDVSKVFVHTSDIERHPRVCSYAWASGIPVVGYGSLALFLSSKFRNKPYFYQVGSDGEYADKILEAIDTEMPYDEIKYEVSGKHSILPFTDKLIELSRKTGEPINAENIFSENLDFRLGRHCTISLGDNSISSTLQNLMEKAKTKGMSLSTSTKDAELELIN